MAQHPLFLAFPLWVFQALIDSGDKEQMEVEVASLLRGINATQKHDARCRLRRTSDGWDMVGYGGTRGLGLADG